MLLFHTFRFTLISILFHLSAPIPISNFPWAYEWKLLSQEGLYCLTANIADILFTASYSTCILCWISSLYFLRNPSAVGSAPWQRHHLCEDLHVGNSRWIVVLVAGTGETTASAATMTMRRTTTLCPTATTACSSQALWKLPLSTGKFSKLWICYVCILD